MNTLRKLYYSLRARLLIFALLATLPALLVTLKTGLDQREQAALTAQQDALRFVRLTAVSQQNLIENTRGFLTALSHSMAYRDNDLTTCGDIFSHTADYHFEFYSAFYVADLEGNLLCTMKDGDIPDNLLECEHYQKLIHAEGFVLSQYHICRNTGKAVISIGHPIMDQNNQPIGVVNISIDLAWLEQLIDNAQIPTNATLMLFDSNGTILTHHPETGDWVGKSLPESFLFNAKSITDEGTSEQTGLDGIQRLYAIAPLEGTEPSIYIAYGLPIEIAYAEADRTLKLNLLLLGLVTLAAVGAAWFLGEMFILRQTQSLVSTTKMIASGDFSARNTKIPKEGELGQLSSAINQMAVSLSQRESALQAYAQELERSNRDLMDFANIASHDLQEPLRKIQVYCDLLEYRYSDKLEDRAKDHLKRLTSAANRMQNLIKDLLAYSRISTQSKPLAKVDLNKVIEQVKTDLDIQIEKLNGQITYEHLPTIEADETQMYQLFYNLLSNALKFQNGVKPPIVTIASETKEIKSNGEQQLTYNLTVEDNGIGFNPKYAERIFLPFQRLKTRSAYDGTGMGLAICRKIVERHGGEIQARSNPGNGSTFLVRLPAKQKNGDENYGSE